MTQKPSAVDKILIVNALAVAGVFFVGNTQATENLTSVQHKYHSGVELTFKREKKKVVVYSEATNSLPWLKSFYETSREAETAKQLLPLISGIKQLFSEKKYDLVDAILSEMEFSKLSSAAMVAFISATYPASHKLEHWQLSVYLVKEHLSNQGLDADEILQGLV
ncbi:hypothetical protein LY624_15125 [Pseudoalteromonas sp. N1230-9]|uniref:hypothetical protein n=1 Tax=Pseudoalteromonas sp. N1230-9 TaxID=2907156 RepID=UPI002B314EA9|nr:hypothetical protein LY624_15125 [Pseudoalteromonas sp. N1230-9]